MESKKHKNSNFHWEVFKLVRLSHLIFTFSSFKKGCPVLFLLILLLYPQPSKSKTPKSYPKWDGLIKDLPTYSKIKNRLIIRPPKGAKVLSEFRNGKILEDYGRVWQIEILLGTNGKPIEYEVFEYEDAIYPTSWNHALLPDTHLLSCARYLPDDREFCVGDVILSRYKNIPCNISAIIPAMSISERVSPTKEISQINHYYRVNGEDVSIIKYSNQPPPPGKLSQLYALYRGYPILGPEHIRYGFQFQCGGGNMIKPFYGDDISGIKLLHKCTKNCLGRPTPINELELELPPTK